MNNNNEHPTKASTDAPYIAEDNIVFIHADSRDIRPVLIFDGDDTLWKTAPLYVHAKDDIAAMVARAGHNDTYWRSLQEQWDVRLVATHKLSKHQFPSSCTRAYISLMNTTNHKPDLRLLNKIHSRAAHVFRETSPPVKNVRRILEQLSITHRIILLTKGDRDIQLKRIKDSKLGDLFTAIFIVDEKSTAIFNEICQRIHCRPENTLSIGNSFSSDIHPALECNLTGIWIPVEHVWSYENRIKPPVRGNFYIAKSLDCIKDICVYPPLSHDEQAM